MSHSYAKVLLLLVVGLSIASVQSEESLDAPWLKLKEMLEVLGNASVDITDNPEMKDWLNRAASRLSSQPQPEPVITEEDMRKIWRLGVDFSRVLHDYVTSPQFNRTTDQLIEQVVEYLSPYVGMMPLREMQELHKILRQNPDILDIVLQHELKAAKELLSMTQVSLLAVTLTQLSSTFDSLQAQEGIIKP